MKSYYSTKLNMNVIMTDEGGAIMEDNTEYTPQEVSMIKGASDNTVVAVHRLKKTFKGEVIYVAEKK